MLTRWYTVIYKINYDIRSSSFGILKLSLSFTHMENTSHSAYVFDTELSIARKKML